MAKSTVAGALLLLSGPAAAAEPLTADAAMRRYREVVKPTTELDCPRAAGEIVVCARRNVADPHRLPLPVTPEPGARIAGEAPRANAGYGDSRYCFERCEGIVGIDLSTAIKAVRGIKRRIEDEE